MDTKDNIGFLIQHLAFTLARQNDKALQENLGIGFAQFKILTAVQWRPNSTQKQIAVNLGQTEASVSRQIKLMYDDGLLQTTQRPGDRREHIVTLTRRGDRVIDRAARLLNRQYAPLFKRLSAKQYSELGFLLKKLDNYSR